MRCTVVAATTIAALLSAAPALAGPRHHTPPKPSIRITGISVNQQNFSPGTTVTRKQPVNACYGIGGPSQSPRSVQAFFFLHAVSIPRSAPTTLDVTTPWDHQTLPSKLSPGSRFNDRFTIDRGHGAASVFGGPDGPYDYFTFDDEGTGSNFFNGKYVAVVTVKVHGRVLRSRAAITIACQ